MLQKSKSSWEIRGKHFILPTIFLAIFMTIAITLWLTKDNVFYLFNFSYIGIALAIGILLTGILPKKIKHRGRSSYSTFSRFIYGDFFRNPRKRKYANREHCKTNTFLGKNALMAFFC